MYLENKSILITGGTGSLGKVLVKRILTGELGTPKKLIVFSRDEGKQHAMRLEYLNQKAATDEIIYSNFKRVLEFRIGDVGNYADVRETISDIDIVVNAAALKHVPVCEYFPHQALLTNCIGANNIVRAIKESIHKVETVVGVSTDKACKPINVMGMTKSIQERIFIAANVLCPKTRFICVRYGNVLCSRGSVIPLFLEQIKNKVPVTITEKSMTRFLLTLNKAVDTIFFALKNALKGDIVVPRAPSANMFNVAKALIGNKDIKICEIGVRPGEKLHEIMVSQEEVYRTFKNGDYYVINSDLPELTPEVKLTNNIPEEYSSAQNVLNMEETIKLLNENNLLSENHFQSAAGDEFLC